MGDGYGLNDRELGTVLAALRLWQKGCTDPELQEIASDEGSTQPLDHDEIDALCEKLNFQPSSSRDASP